MESKLYPVSDLTDKELLALTMCKSQKLFFGRCASCIYNIAPDGHTLCAHPDPRMYYLHKHTKASDVICELYNRSADILETNTMRKETQVENN